jgi:hypothetical protein
MRVGIGSRTGNVGAVPAPRMTVRHGAAGLLAVEALPVLAWALLWASFLVGLASLPLGS